MAIVKIKENQLDLTNTNAAISGINAKIPSQASSSNQLADKAFVNSSIASNTANFIGTFESVAELEAYSGTVTNNDYAFVATTDQAGNTLYDRYKYNGTSWVFEYELNNSSFTAAQWAAINSGATTTNIGQIATNTSNISSLNSSKQDVISDLATIRSGAALGATAVQPSSLATVATSGSYDDLQNKPTIPTVNSPTITLTQGGVTKGSFSLNQSNNDTIAFDAGGGDLPDNVYTTDNLIAGTNISITQVPAPVIDEHTLALWNFENGVNDVIHNIAANTNYGDGTPSQSATKKFGEYGGVGSARLVYNLSSVLPAGTTKLTLDWWEYSTSSYLAEVFLCNYTNINNRPTIIGMDASKYFYVNDQSEKITTESPTANTWTHRCLTVDASTGVAKYFQNGVLKATKTVSAFTIGATNFSLLLNSSYGKVYDEIRVSDVIRWDSNFTPWDEPYTQNGNRVYQINNTHTPSLTWYSGIRGNELTIADTSATNLVKIYKNGILLQPSADYTISGTTLTMDVSLVETDKIALEVI